MTSAVLCEGNPCKVVVGKPIGTDRLIIPKRGIWID